MTTKTHPLKFIRQNTSDEIKRHNNSDNKGRKRSLKIKSVTRGLKDKPRENTKDRETVYKVKKLHNKRTIVNRCRFPDLGPKWHRPEIGPRRPPYDLRFRRQPPDLRSRYPQPDLRPRHPRSDHTQTRTSYSDTRFGPRTPTPPIKTSDSGIRPDHDPGWLRPDQSPRWPHTPVLMIVSRNHTRTTGVRITVHSVWPPPQTVKTRLWDRPDLRPRHLRSYLRLRHPWSDHDPEEVSYPPRTLELYIPDRISTPLGPLIRSI